MDMKIIGPLTLFSRIINQLCVHRRGTRVFYIRYVTEMLFLPTGCGMTKKFVPCSHFFSVEEYKEVDGPRNNPQNIKA